MRVEAWRHRSGGPEEGSAVRGIARRRRGIAAITALGADTDPFDSGPAGRFALGRPSSDQYLPNAGTALSPEQALAPGDPVPGDAGPAAVAAPDAARRDGAPRDVASRDSTGPGVAGDDLSSAGGSLPARPTAPLSQLDQMAAALGVGIATVEDLAAGAGRLVRVDRPDGEAVTLIAVGYGERGPILAVPANPARLGDLARILAVEPAAAHRIRLADPAAFAATLAAAEAVVDVPCPGDTGLFADAGASDWDDDRSHLSGRVGATATPSPDALRRPALRLVGTRRVEAALAAFRSAADGCGAERTVTRRQAVSLGLATVAWAGAASLAPETILGLTVCLAAVCFVGFAALRVAAAFSGVAGGFEPPAYPLADVDLPVYTVLVPLHREAPVVPRLLPALCALDYPPDKLDLKLLLEASDRETIAAVERHPLAHRFDVVMVPKIGPLTKPKALGVGLTLARGDLVTIFDAEDRPDADQLRRAAGVFAAAGQDLACAQARLATDHAGDTWVTAMFALEYAMLFDAMLPWLARHRLPFLLGGTSNHFRKSALLAVGGWDPFNVTEDADLAVRLARRGYSSTVIASTTHEEAPLEVAAWLKQRSRWYKGWLQTALVHGRDLAGLARGVGIEGLVALALQLIGALVTVVAYPLSWFLVAGYSFGALPFGPDGTFVGDLRFALVATAFFGGQAAMALLALAALRLRPSAIRPLALVWLPLYWWLHAFALVLAVVDLVRRPHFWAKTEHGVARRPAGRRSGASAASGGRQGSGIGAFAASHSSRRFEGEEAA